MLANLKHNLTSSVTIIGVICFIICVFFTKQTPLYLMLTVAQLLLVPIMLMQIVKWNPLYSVITVAGMISVTLLLITPVGGWHIALAVIYLIYTLFFALIGFERFLQRGFTNWAEIAIDVGLMYLFVGGLWFFAHVTGIDTGFSPLITWLTGIHFHYSAFLFSTSVGFLGRLHESKLYRIIVPIILAGPMLVALGITFLPLLEVVSVILYIFAIYSLLILSFQTTFVHPLQATFIRLSYFALCVTILFSLTYAAGNAFGKWTVSLDFMLLFHGFFNCIIFGLIGIIGWVLSPPESNQRPWTFPVSKIRGKLHSKGASHAALVDHLNKLVITDQLPKAIVQFYEQTSQFQLIASVSWASWFKPFAVVFKVISRNVQQLNLPLSSRPVEMTGAIIKVDATMDGRDNPRAWIRKVGDKTVFTAIYSQHVTNGQPYMNIALPLPFSTMVGILHLSEGNGKLQLSSDVIGDTGIYLAIGTFLLKLPLSELFIITDENEKLTAIHTMRIFGLPFLRINYDIFQK